LLSAQNVPTNLINKCGFLADYLKFRRKNAKIASKASTGRCRRKVFYGTVAHHNASANHLTELRNINIF
jgi:hypothetical protein